MCYMIYNIYVIYDTSFVYLYMSFITNICYMIYVTYVISGPGQPFTWRSAEPSQKGGMSCHGLFMVFMVIREQLFLTQINVCSGHLQQSCHFWSQVSGRFWKFLFLTSFIVISCDVDFCPGRFWGEVDFEALQSCDPLPSSPVWKVRTFNLSGV